MQPPIVETTVTAKTLTVKVTDTEHIVVKISWLKKVMQDVYDMRQAQREYFQQPTAYKLKVAKAKEQQVDVLLHHATQRGFITAVKTENINQTQLSFNENNNQ